ncbi:MAG TPA: zinc ribbon domain-containing protein [Gemmatimonadota bacterium]|nr:zinc ribbon domain-containing protein [Gemmatimonadota bacterium]
MDDLDRLYFEFVEILRRERPGGLVEPVTVLELYDQLVPYRRIRNAAGLRSNDDYEIALSRLLSGERGYLQGDPVMQQELRAGLEETLPDIRRYHAFPDTRVWLNADLIPPPGHIRYAPPELRQRSDLLEAMTEQPAPQAGQSPGGAAPLEAAAEPETPEVCPVCVVEIPAGSAYCPFCGARLTPGVCRSCGASLDPTWRFCAKCGIQRDDRPDDSP